MKISDILKEKVTKIHLDAKDKTEAICNFYQRKSLSASYTSEFRYGFHPIIY